MKELNDYKAEIFSRSEKRIKERRRRRRTIISFGVPMILVAVILTVWLSQEKTLTQVEDTLNSGITAPTLGSSDTEEPKGDGSTAKQKISVTLSDGTTFEISDTERILEIEAALSGFFDCDTPPTAAGTGTLIKDQLTDASENEGIGDDCLSLQYSFSIISDGAEESYVLSGQQLYCEKDGASIILTEKEAQDLITIITE